MNYIKLSTYAKQNNITYVSAYNHFKKNLIPNVKQLPTGTILVRVDESDNDNNIDVIKIKKACVYARVSSNEMKSNLITQQERLEQFAIVNGFEVVASYAEIGSGLNDKRKKLEKILISDNWDILIVEHKDRLTRFGFNYLETLLNKSNKKILVVNKQDEKKNDLMEDLISIIYSFSARMYGLRRSKRKTEKIIAELKKED